MESRIIAFAILIMFYLFFRVGKNIGIKIMRKRLEEPINEAWKLFGYKVIGKRISRDSKGTRYFFDLKDVLSGYNQIFLKVEVSKRIYYNIKSGKTYPLKLKGGTRFIVNKKRN